MDKSQARGRDRRGDPRRPLNVDVPNNRSMVQQERNNPNNIGNPGTVGNVGNADDGNRTGRNPVGGGGGVAAGRRRCGRRNRGGGGSNTATGSGASGGNQHISGSRDDQQRRTEPGGSGSNTVDTGGRGPRGGNQRNSRASRYEWRRREPSPPLVGGSNMVPDTGNEPSGRTQQIAHSSDDQQRPRVPGDGSRNTQNDQQPPRVARNQGGVGSNSTAPGNGGFGRGIGGMAVTPLLGWLTTEHGWIPNYGGPIGQMTTYGGYSYVNPAIYMGGTMLNGGVVLPLIHDQRMMDQFYGMKNPAFAMPMGGQTGSINQQNLYWYEVNHGWAGDVHGGRAGEPSNREEGAPDQQRQTGPDNQGRPT